MSYKKRVIIFLTTMAVIGGILIGVFVLNTINTWQKVDKDTLVPEDFPELR